MAGKIKGFMSKDRIQKIKNGQADNATFCAIKPVDVIGDYVEVEITIIQPVYEFQVLMQLFKGDRVIVTDNFYTSEKEFIDSKPFMEREKYYFIQLIEQSKRIRR